MIACTNGHTRLFRVMDTVFNPPTGAQFLDGYGASVDVPSVEIYVVQCQDCQAEFGVTKEAAEATPTPEPSPTPAATEAAPVPAETS